MVIDFHTHAFPDALAERAVSVIAEKADITPYYDGKSQNLIRKMDEWGVDKCVVLSIATKPKQETSVNNFAISLMENDRLIPFGSVFPGSENALSELFRLKEAGVKGIKLHSEYQNFFFDDEKAFPIYETCGKLGLIVQFHAGKDIGFFEPFHATPDRIVKTVKAFPNTTFVAAHFGSYSLWNEVYEKLCGIENLYIDTSMSNRLECIPPTLARNIIEKHGFQKMLLASDMPWQETKTSITFLKSLSLPKEWETAILGENAAKLLKLNV